MSACICTTTGCNAEDYQPPHPRVVTSREPKNFIFPFANSSAVAVAKPLARGGRQAGLKCFSCGSLFNRDSPQCGQFDPDNEQQVMTCNEGEACMLYTWKKSKTEIGEYCIGRSGNTSCYHRLIQRVFLYQHPLGSPRLPHHPHDHLLLVQDTAGHQVLHQGLPLHSGLLQQYSGW